MEPTYSLIEAKQLLRKLDAEEVNILKQVVTEESACFSPKEIKVLEKMMQLRMNFLTRHKINIDFSSNYN